MAKLHLGIAALGSVAVLSIAAAQAQNDAPEMPGQPDASRVTAGQYTIDGGHTQIILSYSHFGLSDNVALLSGASGTLTLDPDSPEDAKLSVDVPMDTLHSTIPAMDAEFRKESFFNVAEFPTAHFKSTSVEVDGEHASISGDLTIRGVTRPATIDAKFFAAGHNPFNQKETVSFTGRARIKRSEFGLNVALPLVSDEVDLGIMVAFEKVPDAE